MIWNKDLRTRLFTALSAIEGIRYLSIDFGQIDRYLNDETPHLPLRCPALLISDIREEVERTYLDKDYQPHRLTFTVRLLIDDARFATATAPGEHLAAYDNALALTERIISKVTELDTWMDLTERTETQLRDSLRQYDISFSLIRS